MDLHIIRDEDKPAAATVAPLGAAPDEEPKKDDIVYKLLFFSSEKIFYGLGWLTLDGKRRRWLEGRMVFGISLPDFLHENPRDDLTHNRTLTSETAALLPNTMSDARTLLRAKRQEARISHPYAVYNASGQLRCTACGTPVKSSAMWEGHLGSKVHRVAIAKEKAKQEALERQKEAKKENRPKGKRKADDAMDVDGEAAELDAANGQAKKLRKSEEPDRPQHQSSGFPADFFSDPSKAPVPETDEDEDDADDPPPAATSAPTAAKSQVDLEWEAFQASMLAQNVGNPGGREDEKLDLYDRATVAAEPELVQVDNQGFPESIAPGDNAGEVADTAQVEETEEERQRRKEQEERELIMDRLIEEVCSFFKD